MTLWQAILLGILQGATEFLPVSSSGHLVIVPHLLGWPDPGLALDTILHLGTLVAILIYFWSDLWRLARAALKSLRTRQLDDPNARLAWALVVATIPGGILGVLLQDYFEKLFGMPKAAASFLLVTAALLLLSEYLAKRELPITAMSWWHALLIGLAQALAIVPGLSRSGSTIATGLLLGYRREDATRFSFLLAVPIVLGGGLYQVYKVLRAGIGGVQLQIFGAGFLAAGLTGYLAIAGLLMLVRRRSLWPFALYCATFGVLVLTGVLA
ncbi:MAG: undecaprenyl-diphosphatase UppP [Anaerolineae bacterium]